MKTYQIVDINPSSVIINSIIIHVNIESDVIAQIEQLVISANQDNLGDVLNTVIPLRSKIIDPDQRKYVETFLLDFRNLAARADYGWILFTNPPTTNHVFSNSEILQLFSIERAVHELEYGFETVEDTSNMIGGGSTPSRFYLNSIYHYIIRV